MLKVVILLIKLNVFLKNLSIFYWLWYYSCLIFFSPFSPSAWYPHSLQHSASPPTPVHVHGSYIEVLWFLQFLYYSYPSPVYFVPTNYASYSLYLFPHSPHSFTLLITLQVISISVDLFLFLLLLSLLLFCFFRFGHWYLWFCCHFTLRSFDLLFFR